MNKSDDFSRLFDELPEFGEKMTSFAREIHPELLDMAADHIAVRCNFPALAKSWLASFLELGKLVSENEINQRKIYLILLDAPLQVGVWQIRCVELPFPSQKRYENESWEHIELVVPGGAAKFEENIRRLLFRRDVTFAMRGIEIKYSSPRAEGEMIANPTVALRKEAMTIKLHPRPLLDVLSG